MFIYPIYFLVPGKQITCAIKTIKTTDNTSIVALSTRQKYLEMVLKEIKSMDSVIPGTELTLSVNSVLSNGLQVTYNDGSIGYINQVHIPKTLSHYTPGMELDGTLLYIIPTVKFAYFTLLKQRPEKSQLNKGDIVQSARVLCRESNGVLLKLGKSLRGFVPYRRTDVSFDRMHEIFVPESEHKCRVITYDPMDRVYICSMEKALLNEKHISRSSFAPGEIMDVTITEINEDNGFVTVSFGKDIGTVPPEHVSDMGGLTADIKIGQVVKARVLSSSERCVKFTLKPLLINDDLPLLDCIQNAKVGAVHHGTIRQITPKGMLVKFFGELAGWVPSAFLDPRTSKMNWNHFLGQVVTVEIKAVNPSQNRLTLKIVKELKKKGASFKIGDVVNGLIVDSSVEGIQLKIKQKGVEAIGFLPAGHIAPCVELGGLIAAKSVPGDVLSAVVFSSFPTLLLSTTFVPSADDAKLNKLKVGSTILCSVEEFTTEGLKVTLPIEEFKKHGVVHKAHLENEDLIHKRQILFGKVIAANLAQKEVSITTSIHRLCKDFKKTQDFVMSSIDVLNLYLSKMKNLGETSYYKKKPISSVKLGEKVEGVIEKVTEHGLVLKLKDNLQATVRKDHYKGNLKVGDKVKGAILWVNFVYDLVEVTLLTQLVSQISQKQDKIQNLPLESPLRGTVVFITNWFILVLLKGAGSGCLVALPARLHLNDLNPNLSTYALGQKVRCFTVLNDVKSNLLPICLPKAVLDIKASRKSHNYLAKNLINLTNRDKDLENAGSAKNEIKNKGENNKKRKIEPEETTQKKKLKQEGPKKELDKVKVVEKMKESEDEKEERKLTIPECGFYWDTTPSTVPPKDESSSDSEDENEDQPKQKKKKLSAAERREQERQKEREIREREEAIASSQMPNSADQFEKLLLGSPDSSLVWMQYMAYHLQATEVDRAKAVAKRAVKTINFREEVERLNVWQAWLNLESRFGTPESLDEVFQEAIRVNDAEKIYSHMLTIYADTGKQIDMEKMVNMIVKKFKDKPEMWIKCGASLLMVGLKDKSRHIMQRALQVLPAHEREYILQRKKIFSMRNYYLFLIVMIVFTDVNLIIRFAHLENNLGDKERSQTLFEQIVTTYPKRTDVWSSYVDSLVKSGDIEIARKVLERSVTSLVLPPRKMKVLFKKYVNFEEQYGTPEAVQKVREQANEYVKEHSG